MEVSIGAGWLADQQESSTEDREGRKVTILRGLCGLL
jgi:hypothetical protein